MNFSIFFSTAVCFLVFLSNSSAQTKTKPAPTTKTASSFAQSNSVCYSSRSTPQTVKEGRREQKARVSNKRKMDEIIAAARSRTDALITRDANRLRQLLSPDFVYTNASGKIFDRESYIQTYALDKSVVWTSQVLSEVCIAFSADVAVLTAVTHDVARFGEYRLDTDFRTTQVYRRTNGGWIYLAGHTSNLPQ